jgi:hypothetical protein
MSRRQFNTTSAGSWPVGRPQPTDERVQHEHEIESRANDLAKLVSTLTRSPFPSLRIETELSSRELDALLAMEAKLRWLVRVAKYSVGANRVALWIEAERELVKVEHATDSMLHAKCA